MLDNNDKMLSIFSFKTKNNELDFLLINKEIKDNISDIGNYILTEFPSKATLELELMNESENWQTLFIRIHSNVEWSVFNMFEEKFFNYLFDNYSAIEDKINIELVIL